MKKKILFCALLGAMGAAQSVMAHDFDDRWYVDGSVGFNFQDNDRDTNNAIFGTLGVGKFFSPYWAVELNFNYQNPRFSADQDNRWRQEGVSLDALYNFRKEGRNWWPYVRMGLGYQRGHEQFENPSPLSPVFTRKDGHIATILGAGLQAQYGRYGLRTEVGVRFYADNNSVVSPNKSYFTDFLASVGVTVALGPEPVKAVVPEPAPVAAPNCADLDDDGDGVNNCNDKCPDTKAGQTVGPDGCPVPVTIDLRGVNFDFDKYNLRPDAIATLESAIEVLKKYPELKVEVAGHTDSIGSDAYNQKLSERRARAVYDYLVKNGVDAGRLTGPDGFGESRPIAPNTNPDGTDNPEGRAQNRRTELNVQN